MTELEKTQPIATIREFADLLEQAEALLGKLEEAQDTRNIPFFSARLKLRTHIQFALGMRDDTERSAPE